MPGKNDINLAHVLVGSEGTLGFSTRIELKLSPLLGRRAVGACHFGSFREAMEAAQHIVHLLPIAVELIDRTMIELAGEIPMFRPTLDKFVRGTPAAILLVEFGEDDHEENLRRLRQLKHLIGDLGFAWDKSGDKWGGVVEVLSPELQTAIADLRTSGLNIMMSMKEQGKPVSFVEDCAVPLEHLADYTSRLTAIFEKHGTRGTWYAHAGSGCLHVRPMLNLRQEKDVHAMREIAEEAFAMVREYKGSHSGEHGDGLVRSEFNEPMFGSRLARAFEEVKDRFDPQGLYNPGKVVRPPKFDDRSLFRYAPGYRGEDIKTRLDWSAYTGAGNGFQGAVEMCNNNGACRKLAGGVMCPSYRVTRDERDVTRGRANTLRLAVTGQLGPDALTSDEMAETLKLCVSCKACRRECPTGVDMARMKIEVLAARAPKHGLSLHDRLVGFLPRYAPYAARWPWAFNLRDRIPMLRKVSEMLAGFSGRRSLPKWRADTYRDRSDWAYNAQPSAEPAREVVLFADTFNRYYERENLDAALAVLVAGGYRVHAALPADGEERPLCCGRTFLSVGAVDEARHEMQRTLDTLAPYVARGVPVIGLEPSCLLSFRDELPALIKGEAADALAGQAVLLEEFLAREQQEGRLNLPLGPLPKKALLHGHCHQKAFDAMGAVESVLKLVPGLDVRDRRVRAAAAWRAAFGYDAATIDVSLKMGELSLAAGGAQGARRCADRGRRHLLPASDPRRRRPRGAACRPRAGDEHRGGRRLGIVFKRQRGRPMELGVYTFGDITPDPSTGRAITVPQRYAEILAAAKLADAAGLDVFGIGEHHRLDLPISSPAAVMAAIAAGTKRIRLTSAVTILSTLDPVRVFQDFATVDLLSGGRAEIIAGRGAYIESFALFGADMANYDALFAEKLDLLLRLNVAGRSARQPRPFAAAWAASRHDRSSSILAACHTRKWRSQSNCWRRTSSR